MKRGKRKKRQKVQKTIRLPKEVTTFFILLILIILAYFIFQIRYHQKVYPGLKIGEINFSGQNKKETEEILAEKIDDIYQTGLVYVWQNREVIVEPTIIATANVDTSYDVLRFDPQSTTDRLLNYGRSGSFWLDLGARLKSLIFSQKFTPEYFLDKEELENILKDNFSPEENAAQEAQLIIQGGKIEVSEEKEGWVFDYQTAIKETTNQLENLENKPIELNKIVDQPKIKKEETGTAATLASQVIKNQSWQLKFEEEIWEINQENLRSWLKFKFNEKTKSPTLGLKEEAEQFLKEIALTIDIPAQEAKFALQDDKVIEFQLSQKGRKLEISENIQKMEEEIIQNQAQEMELIIQETEPETTTEEANELGIKELIGLGKSNFSGSPKNRRHNIKVGADTLNGILIKPEEEFSLVQAIGEVSVETGYLPELVIKGNKTIPEYGGGLCQIGTTAFRVALDAGLPITARTNHSYRVSYYEPAGTDATIYNPQPDFKFINDTGHHILFQTKVSGNELIFEFYGTSDGREVEMNLPPRIFNLTKPGPTKIVESEDLQPGERKCTERAHTGADTEFIQKITYANGEIKEEVWKSHYKPWQEVCLVGKEEEN